MRAYEVFGLVLGVEREPAMAMRPSTSPPDVVFLVVDEPVVPREEWGSPIRHQAGAFALHRVAGMDVLDFVDEATFFLDEGRIRCSLADPSLAYIAEIRLLGGVLAYWLESEGTPALHASAVVGESGAIAFCAANGGGKSSLAAELMVRGFRLLTDDILPIDVRNGVPHGRAGYPNMRMWPADAERYTGSTRELRVIHPDFDKLSIPLGERRSFCDQATELAAIYLLDSSDNTDTLKFQRIPPVEAVVALASVSFAAPVAGAAARRRERFAVLTAVANEIPVWWLSYGRRGSSRAEIADAIIEHSGLHPAPDLGGKCTP